MTNPVRVERRAGQRFPYLLTVSVRQASASLEGVGITQDLSSRGVFFFTEVPLTEGSEVELTLRMPAEITLGESMPVRCRARVLRIVAPSGPGASTGDAGAKIGVAARLDSYEYLSACSEGSDMARVSTLHAAQEKERPLSPAATIAG